MELKVWVEGIQRIVCGVTETTTCQDVVFALAHATGKVGRFTLIEKWRNNERMLAPTENPLKILMKWGEYSSDVQFMLQRSDASAGGAAGRLTKQSPVKDLKAAIAARNAQQAAKSPPHRTTAGSSSTPAEDNDNATAGPVRSPHHRRVSGENVGVVRGIPQAAHQHDASVASSHQSEPSISSTNSTATTASMNSGHLHAIPSADGPAQPMPSGSEFNSADVRSSLDRKTSSVGAVADDSLSGTSSSSMSMHSPADGSAAAAPEALLYAHGPPISSNGALVPPPYRDPPPPRASPSGAAPPPVGSPPLANISGASFIDALHSRYDMSTLNTFVHVKDLAADANGTNPEAAAGVIFHNAQYRELLQLIKYQRDKLNVQQTDLSRYDAEIGYLEQRDREQRQQLEAIAREIGQADQQFRQGQEQLQSLQYVEEENELVHQQEKTLKSEITLLRSKLANCETELLQYKNKVRLLLDDIQLEQRAAAVAGAAIGGPAMERHFLSDVERIQGEIEQAIRMAETTHQTADHLKLEVAAIELSIAEKKKQVEKLVNEMKEVNLQSLTVAAPSDEIRHLLEGSSRPGSTRRIIGSPRQLENAVPTSKNPHGVWV